MTRQNHYNEEFLDVEKELMGVKHNIPENTIHEQKLRRALLNSDYFNGSFFIRLIKRFVPDGIFSFPFVSISLFSGVFLAVAFQYAIFHSADLPDTTNRPIEYAQIKTKNAYKDLYQQGKLKYAGQDQDGTRVFYVTMAGNGVVEVRDRAPYIIDFASIDK